MIKQFNFFNWLSNVKNLVLSNGSKHMRNVIQWHKIAFFSQKITKNRPKAPAAGDPGPDPPSVLRLLVFSKRLQSNVFALFNYISLSPLPLQNPG